MNLTDLLIKHEGLKLKPYRCSEGKLTIGVGRNLDDNGISHEEVLYLLNNDIDTARTEAARYPWFDGLSEDRQNVIISMIFNLGLYRFSQFKNTIALIEVGNFKEASREMLDSRWAKQVGSRANELSQMMEEG